MIKQLGVRLRRHDAITIVISAWLGVLAQSLAAEQSDWTRIGPEGHYIRSITVDPGNADILYSVVGNDPSGENQGIYKSRNEGLNWTRLDTNLRDTSDETHEPGISRLVVDGLDSNTLYGWFSGLKNQRLLKSQDGGLNWSLLDVGFSYTELLAAADRASQTSTLYAYQSGFDEENPSILYKSIDGGQHWVSVGLPVQGFLSGVLLASDDGKTLYMLSREFESSPITPLTISKSEDGGVNWSKGALLPEGSYPEGIVVHPQNPSVLYLQAGDSLWKSENDGVNWSIIAKTPENGISALYINPNDPTRFYLASDDIFYQSNDSGLTWQEVSNDLPISSFSPQFAFDPETSDTLYLGYITNGLFKSIDNGQHWVGINSGLNTKPLEQMAINPQQPALIYAYINREVFRSNDYGVTWRLLNNGLTFSPFTFRGIEFIPSISDIDIVPSAPDIIYLVAKSIFKSTTRGENWQVIADGSLGLTPNSRLFVDLQNSDILYGIYAPPSLNTTGWLLLKSSDGGFSWSEVENGLGSAHFSWIRQLLIDPLNSNILYAGLDDDGLYRSVDGAASWQLIGFAGQSVQSLAIDPLTPSTLYISVTHAKQKTFKGIFKSTDGGQNWFELENDFSHPSIDTSLAISPSNPEIVYTLVTTPGTAVNSGIYRSVDGGESWSLITNAPNKPPQDIRDLMIDPQRYDTIYAITATSLYVHNAVNGSIFSSQFE